MSELAIVVSPPATGRIQVIPTEGLPIEVKADQVGPIILAVESGVPGPRGDDGVQGSVGPQGPAGPVGSIDNLTEIDGGNF